jgi:pimeloyl-ACP methyl ester carboxylesterase
MAEAGRPRLLRERVFSHRFRGGLNYYRVMDISWRETLFLLGRKLLQPTLYIVGEDDLVYEFARPIVDQMEKNVPNLWKKVVLPGVGHWTQQEAPEDVTRLIVEFLHKIEALAGDGVVSLRGELLREAG